MALFVCSCLFELTRPSTSVATLVLGLIAHFKQNRIHLAGSVFPWHPLVVGRNSFVTFPLHTLTATSLADVTFLFITLLTANRAG